MKKKFKKYFPFLKYLDLDHYTSPESVPVVTVRGMIYMQLAIFLFILLVALSLGTTETV